VISELLRLKLFSCSFPAEERQDHYAKRRKIEMKNGDANNGHARGSGETGPSPSLQLTAAPQPPQSFPSAHPSLPPRPDFAARADSIGLGGPRTAESAQNASAASQALAGSNRDVVANRRAIRMANMSAAEVLKAELGGLQPVKQSASSPTKLQPPAPSAAAPTPAFIDMEPEAEDEMNLPGLGNAPALDSLPFVLSEVPGSDMDGSNHEVLGESHSPSQDDMEVRHESEDEASKLLQGVKRKFDQTEDSDETSGISDEDEEQDKSILALKVNPDGTVEQEDTVRYVLVFQ
jgi:5'-3' exoribonuclease 2